MHLGRGVRAPHLIGAWHEHSRQVGRAIASRAPADYLPADPTPDLSIVGVEVTQAIQHFQSALGADNTVPLVDSKLTLVRCYLDSGVDPSINGGKVANVTGTLNATGDAAFAVAPIASMTAQPAGSVNRATFTDSLNFLIPPLRPTAH